MSTDKILGTLSFSRRKTTLSSKYARTTLLKKGASGLPRNIITANNVINKLIKITT